MVSKNDHVESFLNSLQVIKDVLSPIEFGIRKAAKDLEHCWPGSKNRANNIIEGFGTQLTGGGTENGNRVLVCSVKKRSGQCLVSDDERKKGLSIKVPFKTLLGFLLINCGSNGCKDMLKKGLKEEVGDDNGTCRNCLKFAVTWSLLLNGFVPAFPSPFKAGKNPFRKTCDDDKVCPYLCAHPSKPRVLCEAVKQKDSKGHFVTTFLNESLKPKEGNNLSIECFIGFVCNQFTQNLQKLDLGVQESECKSCDSPTTSCPPNPFNYLRAVASTLEGKKADVNVFLGNLRFARVGGIPSSVVGVTSVKEEGDENMEESGNKEEADNKEETGVSAPKKLANGLLSIPLSNVERLRSTLSTVSLAELIELIPHLGRSSKDYPDKKKLFSVQDFFKYTEAEGRRFFEELDRDGDGQVTLEDLEVATRKRKLPRRYAREFMSRTRSNIFSKSFGWKQFLSLMEQKEPTILRAYTTLCLSKSGTLKKSEILASLKNAGLPANEDNAMAMMRFLNADTEESISYGHFRNFMLLLPSDRLQEDPRSIWFEAATVVAVAPPVELPASSVLKSALVGGLSCALSCSLLHPVDTIKTRVQASTLTFPEIISKLPQIGVRGLYRGSIPAILGQFSSHGLRTGIFEASRLLLVNVAPNLPDIQVQSIASFCSTFLGTAVRIPCEVLKQRLQAGLFDNVGEAIVGTWNQDGLKGFFRGTGATLFREVPFYVAGMGLYAESKKLAQHLLERELEPWETIAVGALSGGLAAVVTTPFDVMKTRMMTAPGGRPLSMSMVAISIVRHEGLLGLFKGAVPRFFWIAPLGAMNFAGYELARKAMERNEEQKAMSSG
ncbi:mitochondrial substrate carrier family protein C-like [Camellia sinensis]|uniref:mitochondrial substrate carrier family protein C-like n=1 Tax=Camellia sinensis TaxID=4442 RepID=UPI001035A3D1|nr:mitochondrial substrate carrier family protein C-like [Camellia sinensis]XP_028100208.1 mitochondrial substrate carrier family protein C-like [Camellia sinensis]